ncbi:uncharacterized protein LOC122234964 isoform X2 [Panthera tigris]|uniref:uncharacterized protein LOC122234964 isoform X2 n=1 Tax=Panthera tigris TaxID=9694 RepID=UPI001C6F9B75|nr:uncharacterized protein LOC122234964 isoform X2 [Panthera tigris]
MQLWGLQVVPACFHPTSRSARGHQPWSSLQILWHTSGWFLALPASGSFHGNKLKGGDLCETTILMITHVQRALGGWQPKLSFPVLCLCPIRVVLDRDLHFASRREEVGLNGTLGKSKPGMWTRPPPVLSWAPRLQRQYHSPLHFQAAGNANKQKGGMDPLIPDMENQT